jgi:hypothetical protein
LHAARTNIFPGLLLQAVMACFIALYLFHDGTREFLAKVGTVRSQIGYSFAVVSYIFSGSLLPEVLRVVFFQKGRVGMHNLWRIASMAPLWAMLGIFVDYFYRLQGGWFGVGNTWDVVFMKVAVDQLVFSPLIVNPLVVAYLAWQNERFRTSVVATIFSQEFLNKKIIPTQIAVWCVWLPGVSLVYSMPPLLQLPMAVLIQCFWVLILTTINESGSRD